jgi:hypothetical protein
LLLAACGANPAPGPDAGATGRACTGPSPDPGLASSQLANQLQESEYIVHATVVSLHAKTIPDTIDTSDLAVVHVDTVLFADQEMHDLGNALFLDRDVTLKTTSLPAVGFQGYFLTDVFIFNGGELAVSEVAHFDNTHAAFGAAVPGVESLFASQPLYARLASADRVVVGTVTSTAMLPLPCGSEHCAAWAEAVVQVDDSLCGPDQPSPVRVAFASSTDVAWVNAPKLVVGQAGVLMLHHSDIGVPLSATPPDLLVVNALDVQPRANEAMLQALLTSPPSP